MCTCTWKSDVKRERGKRKKERRKEKRGRKEGKEREKTRERKEGRKKEKKEEREKSIPTRVWPCRFPFHSPPARQDLGHILTCLVCVQAHPGIPTFSDQSRDPNPPLANGFQHCSALCFWLHAGWSRVWSDIRPGVWACVVGRIQRGGQGLGLVTSVTRSHYRVKANMLTWLWLLISR